MAEKKDEKPKKKETTAEAAYRRAAYHADRIGRDLKRKFIDTPRPDSLEEELRQRADSEALEGGETTGPREIEGGPLGADLGPAEMDAGEDRGGWAVMARNINRATDERNKGRGIYPKPEDGGPASDPMILPMDDGAPLPTEDMAGSQTRGDPSMSKGSMAPGKTSLSDMARESAARHSKRLGGSDGMTPPPEITEAMSKYALGEDKVEPNKDMKLPGGKTAPPRTPLPPETEPAAEPETFHAEGDPYSYILNPDNSVTIAEGPTGKGLTLRSGKFYDAIMGQIEQLRSEGEAPGPGDRETYRE